MEAGTCHPSISEAEKGARASLVYTEKNLTKRKEKKEKSERAGV